MDGVSRTFAVGGQLFKALLYYGQIVKSRLPKIEECFNGPLHMEIVIVHWQKGIYIGIFEVF
jgi:hypothetical protein